MKVTTKLRIQGWLCYMLATFGLVAVCSLSYMAFKAKHDTNIMLLYPTLGLMIVIWLLMGQISKWHKSLVAKFNHIKDHPV